MEYDVFYEKLGKAITDVVEKNQLPMNLYLIKNETQSGMGFELVPFQKSIGIDFRAVYSSDLEDSDIPEMAEMLVQQVNKKLMEDVLGTELPSE